MSTGTCYSCGAFVSFEKITLMATSLLYTNQEVLKCPACHTLQIYEEDIPVISPLYGEVVKNLPPEIESIYSEIKRCYQVKAYTAVAMLTRKLLMHIAAVEENVKEGEKFAEYVKVIADSGHLPKNALWYLDEIRKAGNDANHKLENIDDETAKKFVDFWGIMLRAMYEHTKPEAS